MTKFGPRINGELLNHQAAGAAVLRGAPGFRREPGAPRTTAARPACLSKSTISNRSFRGYRSRRASPSEESIRHGVHGGRGERMHFPGFLSVSSVVDPPPSLKSLQAI